MWVYVLDALKAGLAALLSRQADFEQHLGAVKQVYTDILELSDWYRNYRSAHAHLLAELERRDQYDAAMAQHAARFKAQMDALSAQEDEQRAAFAEQYGVYLPEAMCPEVQDKALRVISTTECYERGGGTRSRSGSQNTRSRSGSQNT